MIRDTHQDAVDQAFAPFEQAVLGWLAAGGSGRILIKWLLGRLRNHQDLAKAIDSGVRANGTRKTLAEFDTLP